MYIHTCVGKDSQRTLWYPVWSVFRLKYVNISEYRYRNATAARPLAFRSFLYFLIWPVLRPAIARHRSLFNSIQQFRPTSLSDISQLRITIQLFHLSLVAFYAIKDRISSSLLLPHLTCWPVNTVHEWLPHLLVTFKWILFFSHFSFSGIPPFFLAKNNCT